MKIQTLTGPSIHAALKEARRLFGDEVVLLESEAPTGTRPARITVMADKAVPAPTAAVPNRPLPRPAPKPRRTVRKRELVPAGVEEDAAPAFIASPPRGYGYHAARTGRTGAPIDEAGIPVPQEPVRRPLRRPAEMRPARRDRLFAGDAMPGPRPEWASLEGMVTSQLEKLEAHYARLERRLSETIISATREWVTHPFYAALHGQGLRPRTLTRLFQRLAEQGFDPHDDRGRLKKALVDAMGECLEVAHQKVITGTQLFLGPGGSGKTTLLLKLARHPRFFGRRACTVIILRPENEDALPYQAPVELYQRFEIPVQTVRNAEEMNEALHRVRKFAHVFIDTPPLPLRTAALDRYMTWLQRLVGHLAPLQIHLVLNAAGQLDAFDEAFLDRLPVRPDTVDVTHLDEAPLRGHLIECLIRLGLPVQFAGDGNRIPNSIAAFSVGALLDDLLVAPETALRNAWDLL